MQQKAPAPTGQAIELLPKAPPSGRSAAVLFWARGLGIPLIIALQLIFFGILAFRVKLELDLRSLATTVQEKEAVLAQTEEFENTFLDMQKRLELISRSKLELCHSCAIRTLENLTPQGVILTGISLEGTKLELSAQTSKGGDFASFVANILEDEAVAEAAILTGGLDAEGKFIFTMELILEKGELLQ
ncbi:hypothetical protein GTO10_02325 [Candidatus Saccharibacteria bacterium]|nr:hypothetical protein [Candidatus Saccharibacteria bacterium]